MRSLLIILSVVGVAIAKPGNLGLGLDARGLLQAPLAYPSVAAPVAYSTIAAPAPIAAPLSVSSQHHAQDELGQYSYGYSSDTSSKSEVKTFDGVTRGGYSYIDAEGKVQSVNYISDPVNGFRVAATNLPGGPTAYPSQPLVGPVQDTPEVAAAKQAHFIAYAKAKAAAEAAPEVTVSAGPLAIQPAAAAVARADILPSRFLFNNLLNTFPYSAYAPALGYGGVTPAGTSYSAIAPSVAPAPFAYQASLAPVSRFAYSTVSPALPYAHYPYAHPFSYAHHPYSYTPHPISYSAVAPVTAPAQVTYATPQSISSQYHAQDELGQYSYGYAGGPSAKHEVRTFDGVTRGGYSYIDANGKIQTVNYIADPVNGFRVAATNLPVGPQATLQDTAEVAAKKFEHLAAVEEAKIRLNSA